MLIKKVNSTFESLDKARGLMTDWNERLSKTVRDVLLNGETQEFLRDLFTSSDGSIMTLLGKFIELTTVTFLSNNNAHYLNNFNHYFINLTPFLPSLPCPALSGSRTLIKVNQQNENPLNITELRERFSAYFQGNFRW